jgi:hypothetical protein
MCYSAVHILIYLLDIVLNYTYCQCIRYIVLLLSADMLNGIPSLSTSCFSIRRQSHSHLLLPVTTVLNMVSSKVPNKIRCMQIGVDTV